MKSGKFYLHIIAFFSGMMIPVPAVLAQPSEELQTMQEKYPRQTSVIEYKMAEIEIELKKSTPLITITSGNTEFILKDNSSHRAGGKEYFNSRLTLNRLKAYTLIPHKSRYRKKEVKDYTRSTDIQSGVFYDDLYSYSFTFPSVSAGTKLHTESTAVTDDPFYPIKFFFGDYLPVKEAKLRLVLDPAIDVKFRLFGTDTTGIECRRFTEGKKKVIEWIARDLPIYRPEEWSPGFLWITPHIIVQTAGYEDNGHYRRILGSIEDLYNWCYSRIEEVKAENSPAVKALTDSLVSGGSTEREMVDKIFRWVQQNIRYVAIEDGDNGFVPRPASLVLQRRYGDCKDKSCLLNAMMKSQGFNASFAWVGSRDLPYRYSEIASLAVDNHMIAVWWDENEQPVFLDGTARHIGLGEIPSFILGKECLIERGPDKFLLKEIPQGFPEANTYLDSVVVKVKNDTIYGKGRSFFNGEFRPTMINRFEGKEHSRYPSVLSSFLPMASNKFLVKTAELSEVNRVNGEIEIEYDFIIPDYISRRGENIYLNLNINRFFEDYIKRQDEMEVLKNDHPMFFRSVSVLDLPHEVVPPELPEATGFENDLFSFTQTYEHRKNQVVLRTEVKLDFLLLRDEELAEFREMIGILNHNYLKSIVLTKKNQP